MHNNHEQSAMQYVEKQRLSLCMIVKNEEKFLQSCLESVKDIVDDFDKEMQAKFPNLLVDAFLKVGVPMNSQDSCFETEASERLNSGDSASRIIPYNETWGR